MAYKAAKCLFLVILAAIQHKSRVCSQWLNHKLLPFGKHRDKGTLGPGEHCVQKISVTWDKAVTCSSQSSCCVMMLQTSRLFVTAFPFISPVKPHALCTQFFLMEPLDHHKPIPPHASLEISLESLESWPSKAGDKMGISILKQPESPRVCTQTWAPQLWCCHALLAVLAGTKPCLGLFYKPWTLHLLLCLLEGRLPMVLVPNISQRLNSQFNLGSSKASDFWETAGSSGWLLKYSWYHFHYPHPSKRCWRM